MCTLCGLMCSYPAEQAVCADRYALRPGQRGRGQERCGKLYKHMLKNVLNFINKVPKHIIGKIIEFMPNVKNMMVFV